MSRQQCALVTSKKITTISTNLPQSYIQINRSTFPISQLPSSACGFYKSFNENLLLLLINVTTVDPPTSTLTFQIDMLGCGDFSTLDPFIPNRYNLAVPVNVTFDTTLLTLTPGLPLQSRSVSTRFATGVLDHYPFESYTTNLIQVLGYYQSPRSSTPSRLPIQMFLVGAIQGYKIDVLESLDVSDNSDGTLLNLQLQVKRSFTTRLFSMFVVILMWVLSLLTVSMALTPWMIKRKVDIPTITFGMGLLFALPAVRNAQPGVPAIGATVDVVSFFWAMIITASAGEHFYLIHSFFFFFFSFQLSCPFIHSHAFITPVSNLFSTRTYNALLLNPNQFSLFLLSSCFY
jgi:hypothetical protein